jgi:hypothetical protein
LQNLTYLNGFKRWHAEIVGPTNAAVAVATDDDLVGPFLSLNISVSFKDTPPGGLRIAYLQRSDYDLATKTVGGNITAIKGAAASDSPGGVTTVTIPQYNVLSATKAYSVWVESCGTKADVDSATIEVTHR